MFHLLVIFCNIDRKQVNIVAIGYRLDTKHRVCIITLDKQEVNVF